MDLFAITCTTCKSRLKVRDQAAIGQILACPKCGGMVMVKPPPVWTEASDQKSDLPTATEVEGPALRFDQTVDSSAFDVLEDLLSDAPPKVQPPPSPASATPAPAAVPVAPKPRFVSGPPHRSSTPPGPTVRPIATPATIVPIQLPPKAAVPPSTGPTSNGNAPPPVVRGSKTFGPPPPAPEPAAARQVQAAGNKAATSGRNHLLLMGASVLVGVLVAFAAVTGAIHLFRPSNVGKAIPAPKPAPPSLPDANVPEKAPVVIAPPVSESAVSPDSSSSANSSAATIPPPVSSDSALPPATTAVASPLNVANETTTVVAPSPANDPLAKFDNIIGGTAVAPLAKSVERPTDEPPLPPPDPTPARPLAPRPAPREIDVAKRLADPLPAIETSGTTLADFAQFLSDLSTIPITLDVPFVPATPDSVVSLRLANTTVGNALAEALAPLRLEYVVVDDQLVVRRKEPATITPIIHSVKNLTGNDEQQLTELAEMLKAVVEPGAWDAAEGGGSIAVDAAKAELAITQRRAVQFQVLLAIEKLRAARTPPLAHELKLDAGLFKLDTRWSLAKSRLEKVVSLNYSQPTRLVTILDRLGTAAGMRILVDWRDVAGAGWNPAGEGTLVVSNQLLADALDALLDPLDLAWRIVDGQTVQVVTPVRLAEQAELEFYKIDDLLKGSANGEAILAQVRAALGEGTFLAGGGNGEIRFEAEGKCLLAWLPQVKQLELETLLTKWRTEGSK